MAASEKIKKEKEAISYHQTDTQSDGRNLFQNDGSFMEMFKLQQQQELQQKQQQQSSADLKSKKKSSKTKAEASGEGKTENSPSVSYAPPPPAFKYKSGGAEDQDRKTSRPQQGAVGKRKALMKTAELREKRKRRREELEEQQNAELKEQKSSAWKSYMAEVKAYEARNCGDGEDHKRPLVK